MNGIKRVFTLFLVFVFLGLMIACDETTETDETYVIRFVSEGIDEIEEIEAEALSLIELPVLERPGYVFKGWYEEEDD